jgi:hypothetical protein
LLIEERLDTEEECRDYPNVCELMRTKPGKERVFDRIKQIILDDGITNIDTAIANVETELIFSDENT